MCLSRLQRVVGTAGPDAVWAEDADGRRHRLCLLAFDGDAPRPGDWLVAHSGYALGPADAAGAAAAVAELRAVTGSPPAREPTSGAAPHKETR